MCRQSSALLLKDVCRINNETTKYREFLCLLLPFINSTAKSWRALLHSLSRLRSHARKALLNGLARQVGLP